MRPFQTKDRYGSVLFASMNVSFNPLAVNYEKKLIMSQLSKHFMMPDIKQGFVSTIVYQTDQEDYPYCYYHTIWCRDDAEYIKNSDDKIIVHNISNVNTSLIPRVMRNVAYLAMYGFVRFFRGYSRHDEENVWSSP